MNDEIWSKELFIEKLIEEHQNKSTLWKGKHCSFCGTSNVESKGVVAGPNGVFICNGCTLLAYKVLEEKGKL